MPHKHTRKGEDKSTLDLPPSQIAQPLPTSKSAAANGIFTSSLTTTRTNKKRKRNKDAADDTPKAFARLMAFQNGKKLPKGLDDGVKISKKAAAKKRKLAANKDDDDEDDFTEKSANPSKGKAKKDAAAIKGQEVPTIRPGEKMSDFSARVDAALPLSGLLNKSGKNGKDPLGLKVGRTKTEKRMHRMYAEWREQEQRIRDKREEERELREEEEMGEDGDGRVRWVGDIEGEGGGGANTNKKKRKGKGKGKKKMAGEIDDGDDDPWAQLVRSRAEAKVGLHDVALAPPSFLKVPREKFKLREAGRGTEVRDVPNKSGSLRRREELGMVRRGVVEGYRMMMKGSKSLEKERGEGGEE